MSNLRLLQEISLSFEDEAVSEPVLFLTGSNILVDESELDDPCSVAV